MSSTDFPPLNLLQKIMDGNIPATPPSVAVDANRWQSGPPDMAINQISAWPEASAAGLSANLTIPSLPYWTGRAPTTTGYIAPSPDILARIADFLGHDTISFLGRQGSNVARAGDMVGLGGTGLAAAGAVTAQPEIVATGLAGMGVGSILSNLGKAAVVASDTLSHNRNAAVKDAIGAGLGNVLPPGVDPQPAIDRTAKYFGF